MIELRWLSRSVDIPASDSIGDTRTVSTSQKVLQSRTREEVIEKDEPGRLISSFQWTKWADVPTVYGESNE